MTGSVNLFRDVICEGDCNSDFTEEFSSKFKLWENSFHRQHGIIYQPTNHHRHVVVDFKTSRVSVYLKKNHKKSKLTYL